MKTEIEMADQVLICDALAEAAERWELMSKAHSSARMAAARREMAERARAMRTLLLNAQTVTVEQG